ncbi:MAG: hypothetical protein NMNS01_16220 [Nitrosomonas sp.]|nr:MAG: hypothetical protein NMNS01_16220 [Nitrosomonas sp.]
MHCHEVGYKIIGHDIQMVEIALDPGETVIAEAGAMTYLEQDICFDTKLGGGLRSMFFGGEGLFLATLSGTGSVWI